MTVPAVGLVVALVALVSVWRGALAAAANGQPVEVGGSMMLWAMGLFLAASACVLAAQALHVAGRVAGPELRLRQALQRIRAGDLSFRVQLRRGDPLADLATECNLLLDSLARSAPAGTQVGADIVQLPSIRQAAPAAGGGK